MPFLPVVPEPLPGELLSSWLRRISRKYGRTSGNFCNLLSTHGFRCDRDIDLVHAPGLLNDIAASTGISSETLTGMQLISLEGKLFGFLDKTKKEKPLFRTARKDITLVLYGLQLCPQCLYEDKAPFFRKKWRLAFVVCCTQHSLALVDRCQKCGLSFRVQGQQALQKLTTCRNCGFDLVKSKRQFPFDERTILFQERLLSILEVGEVEIEKELKIPSFDFFSLLYQMFKLYCLYNKTYKVIAWCKTNGVRLYTEDFCYQGYIDLLSSSQRATLLSISAYIFEDWPNRLVEFCNKTGIYSVHLFKRGRCAPPYFFHLLNSNNLWSSSDDSQYFEMCPPRLFGDEENR